MIFTRYRVDVASSVSRYPVPVSLIVAGFKLITINNAVQPHPCGEWSEMCNQLLIEYGSAPRSWGILILLSLRSGGWRFSPTPVGNTSGIPTTLEPSAVQPHACGEYTQCIPSHIGVVGSAPRLWGILTDPHSLWNPGRFSPTPVGNTLRKNQIKSIVYN